MPFWSRVFFPKKWHRPSVELDGGGMFLVRAVGESSYQRTLKRIVGANTADALSKPVDVLLVPYRNRRDRSAVAVTIHGKIVGHLSQDNALLLRKQMEADGHRGESAACPGRIIIDRRRSQDNVVVYGVELDVSVL
jgi:hypothetical protein